MMSHEQKLNEVLSTNPMGARTLTAQSLHRRRLPMFLNYELAKCFRGRKYENHHTVEWCFTLKL